MKLSEIPKGFKTLLPEKAKKREYLINRIKEIVELWGYEPVVPPTIEFLDTFKLVDEKLEDVSFKLVDRFTGRLLAVRPDFTPQIARIVASSFKDDEPPFRFYYSGKVFRDSDEDREIFQFGFELIGVDEREADAEVVAVVVNVLRELGLKSFQIDIGHTEFLNSAVGELSIENRKEVVEILSHKDFSGLEIFCDQNGIEGERREKLRSLLELYGKEEVFERAEELFKSERVKRTINELKEVYGILKSYGFEKNVIFDLSERRGMEYHTGITFEVFHPLHGFSLGGGGRYNTLIEKFGRKLPATGIAVNVDALQELLERKNSLNVKKKKDFYIVDLRKELQTAYRIASELRNRGYSVSRDIVKRNYETSVKVAFKKGFKYVIVLNKEKEPKNLLFLSEEKFVPLPESTEEILDSIEKLIMVENM
ncbi:ATP phosphoribosyltransferase regulatory subunit [Balnearium lithotrophicum]|uniref:ATP phosphoribosyltransferase regulatory subunit n=1 Tax=Balnearium lithotrophicum TaxID=223788 RepID=A0A521CVG1_9BACT|nr:ATP phosphoribosyltransferase regulatory subunit [Balnearium lithotrophicum]SMO63408.1 ATP phosphoribosyltransferase regulatory subunit [Balnearium lithotrophicum]